MIYTPIHITAHRALYWNTT